MSDTAYIHAHTHALAHIEDIHPGLYTNAVKFQLARLF